MAAVYSAVQMDCSRHLEIVAGFDGRRAHGLENEARCNVAAAILDKYEILRRAGCAGVSAGAVKGLSPSP